MHDRIIRVMSEVLGVMPSALGESASPESVESWDSLRHMNLIVALEEEFGVVFGDDALATLTTFRGIREALAAQAPS
jgi:acyl carrier protein